MSPIASTVNDIPTRIMKLLPRATSNSTQKAVRTGLAVWGIVLIVIVLVCLVFCGVVLCLIMKNKRRRKQRQRDLEAKRPLNNEVHEYRAVSDRDSSDANSRVAEMPSDNQVTDTTPHKVSELPPNANVMPKYAEADSHQLPAKYDSPAPVELPASVHTKTTS